MPTPLSAPTLDELEARLLGEGVAQVGYSSLREALPDRYRHLPYGITLVYKLSDAVVDEIVSRGEPSPTFSYFQHYRAVNAFLDAKTLWLTAMLERTGARALPIPASQSVTDTGPFSGAFPHKTAAVLAGLGFIGRSALFVSPTFGPRVRLATVLTDYPLPVTKPDSLPDCGGCMRCVNACPASAIKGNSYEPGCERSHLFDPQACSEHMKRAYRHIGRGAVCGVCMAICPFGEHAYETT